MNDIELRGVRPAPLLRTREEKRHHHVDEAILNEARESDLKGAASAALVSHRMERTVDLYKYGETLAGDDPVLRGLMSGFVGDYAGAERRRQRAFDSGFTL